MARLLLIDDDRSLLELLSGFLAPQGFAVTTADGGRAGLRALYADHPDLIVLDVTMPEKDGWETLKAIRDLSPAPVIMLTARGDEADVLRGFALGADDYVTKPFSFALLHARISAVLARGGHGTTESANLTAGDLEVNLAFAMESNNTMQPGEVLTEVDGDAYLPYYFKMTELFTGTPRGSSRD